MADYVDAVIAEISDARSSGRLGAVETLFVGGGTPSLLPPEELARMISAVERIPGAESTVECNPESVSDELLATLRDVGVTRISLGVQSLILGSTTPLGAIRWWRPSSGLSVSSRAAALRRSTSI